MPTTQVYTMYCPRCDRVKTGTTEDDVLEQVKKHVAENHQDHDPLWWETYPESFNN